MTDKSLSDRLLLLIDDFAGKEYGGKKRFAEMLGVTQANINNWINLGSLPSSEHLANIQKKLGVNIIWLLTGEGEMFVKKESPPTVHEALTGYGFNSEEREYIDKLITIFRTKDAGTKSAIMQNINTFLKVPVEMKGKDTLKKKAG